MTWAGYVKAATDLGFTKVCIIARQGFGTLATTNDQTDIARMCKDPSGGPDINENQELLDDWQNASKATFTFFNKKMNIVVRDSDDGYIVCAKGKEVICAREFKTLWFIVCGTAKGM